MEIRSDLRVPLNQGKSSEEEDHLLRSTKKIKNPDLPEETDIGDQQIPVLDLPSTKTFKEALATTRNGSYAFNSRVEILSSDEEDDEVQEGHSTIQAIYPELRGFPTISLPKKLLAKIRKPWENALIVRLLGKNIGYNMLCSREDCTKVFTEGPWVIMDHYLTVRRWEPNFKPSEAFETTTAVWVRFPELPIEYYQEKVLFAIAKSIGKPLKIDWTTAMATRGKFARVCVEMDLSQPLKPKFILEGKLYSIEYESLHSFCFLCGRVDHRKEACRFKPLGALPAEDNGHLQQERGEDEAFGPWMLVTKRYRKPTQPKRIQDPHGPITNPNSFRYLEGSHNSQTNNSRGKKPNKTGMDKAHGEPSVSLSPSQANVSKGKAKLGMNHTRPKDSDTLVTNQSLWKPMGESSTTHAKDFPPENPLCEQAKVNNLPSENQVHQTTSDMIYTLENTPSLNDSTMVEVNSTPVAATIPETSAILKIATPLDQDKEPPDLGETNNGRGRQHEHRSTTTRGDSSSEPDPQCEPIVRTRE
ncbi:uncharacterized protein LOC114309572 [Camellia sinensis]|uniref:uncharacterized protein LOC114309572 n=1 Tax=Camellia sinensis TaxID=4442 RepID=UPI001036A825|nr:uncharacterized protein LOC114309572 [Camellia sinensis]